MCHGGEGGVKRGIGDNVEIELGRWWYNDDNIGVKIKKEMGD